MIHHPFPGEGIKSERDGAQGDGSEARRLDLAGRDREKREAVVKAREMKEADQCKNAHDPPAMQG